MIKMVKQRGLDDMTRKRASGRMLKKTGSGKQKPESRTDNRRGGCWIVKKDVLLPWGVGSYKRYGDAFVI